MKYLAHSAQTTGENIIPAQPYENHVSNVIRLAGQYAEEAGNYSKSGFESFVRSVLNAADFHDLGKLHPEIQEFLHHPISGKHLPLSHFDEGTVFCRTKKDPPAAIAISSHHAGLPNFSEASVSGHPFRDENKEVREFTDTRLDDLISTHLSMGLPDFINNPFTSESGFQIKMRMILSCLADADHGDTARNYNPNLPDEEPVPLKALERLERLNQYVDQLGAGKTDERSLLRRDMYLQCRDSDIPEDFSSCDSPVGSGKTTAVMAHLLRQAVKRHLRRIFVVLPFTNIITQSVETYRKCLVLPGENPEMVVAELHHNVDMQNPVVRYLTPLWRAPIIVTTAVGFFETLASNRPSSLRRLHELPGSAIFIDESHAALPVHLWPLAWQWMHILSEKWSCYWVMASGSQTRFWNISEIAQNYSTKVPEIVPEPLRDKLSQYENRRVTYLYDDKPNDIEELIQLVVSKPGPRLVIMNTVQSAAVIANCLKERFGRNAVEHISTALIPADRAKTIQRVHNRLSDENDKDWTLVATSCVEAGVDFSFRTGFRELGTLVSLLQAAGRVNRGGQYPDAEMWTFRMKEGEMLKTNPGIRYGAQVLQVIFESGRTPSPALCNEALKEELRCQSTDDYEALLRAEGKKEFKTVKEKFKVIDSNTVPVIISTDLAGRIRNGQTDWKEVQRNSVQINYFKVVNEYHLSEIVEGIYEWNLGLPKSVEIYNDFIGYMQGVLEWENRRGSGGSR